MVSWNKVKRLLFLIFLREFRYENDKIEYRLKNVPFKKTVNLLKISFNRDFNATFGYFNTTFVWGFPYLLQINPFFGCILNCPKCPSRKKNSKIKQGELPFNVFKKYLDEVGDYAVFLTLWCWGEPFLNKKLPEMIKYAKSKKMIVRTSTNGNLLNDEEFNKRIILSGLDELIIALDGATEKTYLKYRRGGNFKKVIEGTKNLVELKKRIKAEKPLINLRMVVMRSNEHEIPLMKKLAEKLDVDVLTLKTVNPNFDGAIADESLIPKNKRYHRYAYHPGTLKKIEPRGEYFCFLPWWGSTLFSDGTIVACEYDHNVDFPFGNIKNQSFKEIWFGEKADQFREQFSKDKEVFEFCKNCSYKGMIIESCVAEKLEIKK